MIVDHQNQYNETANAQAELSIAVCTVDGQRTAVGPKTALPFEAFEISRALTYACSQAATEGSSAKSKDSGSRPAASLRTGRNN